MRTDYSNIYFKENGKLKLLIVVGTRPEIIRLGAVINKCRSYFDCILAHTGQNYDYNLNGVFFRDLKLDDPEVYMDAVGDDLGATVGKYHQLLLQADEPDPAGCDSYSWRYQFLPVRDCGETAAYPDLPYGSWKPL